MENVKSPKLLAGLGVVSFISSAYLAALGATKSSQVITEQEKMLGRPLTNEEKFRATGRYFVPSVLFGLIGTGFIGLAFNDIFNKNAALVAAIGLSEGRLTEVFRAIREEYGEEKERDIRTAVMSKEIATIQVPSQRPVTVIPDERYKIHDPGYRDMDCYDAISGRYFHDTQDHIVDAINRYNEDIIGNHGCGCLNTLYDYLNNPELGDIPTGFDLGWNDKLEPAFSWISKGRGIPCLVMDFYNPPVYNYKQW